MNEDSRAVMGIPGSTGVAMRLLAVNERHAFSLAFCYDDFFLGGLSYCFTLGGSSSHDEGCKQEHEMVDDGYCSLIAVNQNETFLELSYYPKIKY